MHAILHSFTYLLKLLTQAPISIQPMPILHTTHNHVHSTRTYRIRNTSALPFLSPPFHPDVPRILKSFSANILSGCLTPGIPLCSHFIWVSHSRNPFALPFHPGVSLSKFLSSAIPPGCLASGIQSTDVPPSPGVSHPESSPPPFHPGAYPLGILSAVVPPGCLTPEIPLRCHFIRVSHSRNPSAPPFHPGVSLPESLYVAIPSGCLTLKIPLLRHSTRMPCIRNPIHRRSTFLGCLTLGIQSADVPPSPDISHLEFYPANVPPFSSSLEHYP